LRHPYLKPDRSVGYRCPGEPEADYVRKGGSLPGAEGRRCLCNALFAAIGMGQPLTGTGSEPAILTAGEDVVNLRRFLPSGAATYCAADVLGFMLGLGLLAAAT
jgi:nitronate monooxygenase